MCLCQCCLCKCLVRVCRPFCALSRHRKLLVLYCSLLFILALTFLCSFFVIYWPLVRMRWRDMGSCHVVNGSVSLGSALK